MNYPLRFVLFGGALLALCFMLQKWLLQRRLFTVSKAMGLTYLFIALWILSIFGYRDPTPGTAFHRCSSCRGRCYSASRRASVFISV
jgi:hypothetical protein